MFLLEYFCFRFVNIWLNSSSGNSFFIVNGSGSVNIYNVTVKGWTLIVGTPSIFNFGIASGGLLFFTI
jgi:hypothetical protein